jgi:hypothetical protein
VGRGWFRIVNHTNGMVADSFGNTGNAMQTHATAATTGSGTNQWTIAGA